MLPMQADHCNACRDMSSFYPHAVTFLVSDWMSGSSPFVPTYGNCMQTCVGRRINGTRRQLACGCMLAECSADSSSRRLNTHLQGVCVAEGEHPLGPPRQEEAAVGGHRQRVQLLGALLAGQVPAVERVQMQA